MTLLRKLTMILDVARGQDLPPIVTLLTDFGLVDSYVGQLKGVLYSINPKVRVVDLTHSIAPGDIIGASFVLKTSYQAFPENTTHLVVVDPGVGGQRRPIIVDSSAHLFVGPDNGVFSYIYDENDFQVFEIANPEDLGKKVSYTFHGRDVFAPAAAHLSLGVKPEALGTRLERFVRFEIPTPRIDGSNLRGQVVHTDSFGNLITNIPRHAVEGRDETTIVEIRGTRIEGMCKSYEEREEGTLLAIWGSSDLLEISLSRGRADHFLGVTRGEPVVIRMERSNSN